MLGFSICLRAMVGIMILNAEHGKIFINGVRVVTVDVVEMNSDPPALADAAYSGVPV